MVVRSASLIGVIQANTSMAFCLNNRELHLNQTSIVQTTCSGLMCDKGRPEDWNGVKGCGCVGMNPNISNLAFVHSIWFDTHSNNGEIQQIQNRITHSNFSSTKFYYLTPHASYTELQHRIQKIEFQIFLSP